MECFLVQKCLAKFKVTDVPSANCMSQQHDSVSGISMEGTDKKSNPKYLCVLRRHDCLDSAVKECINGCSTGNCICANQPIVVVC
jgi:hypothetical protein|mmetsp:Transcript_20604/g.37442  ORF Transcript_20604/g.37442 Transcript_20604/m.37442 type:complete len:85 (-) Transcript_20604:191-445(-)